MLILSRSIGNRVVIRDDYGTAIWATMHPGGMVEVDYDGIRTIAERHIIVTPCNSRIVICYKLSHYRMALGKIGKAHAIGIEAPLHFEIMGEELLV